MYQLLLLLALRRRDSENTSRFSSFQRNRASLAGENEEERSPRERRRFRVAVEMDKWEGLKDGESGESQAGRRESERDD